MSISATINRNHKSTLFCFIFGSVENKKHLLSLYNAVNNTTYTNSEDIQINTLEDVIYIRMKNDVSFILDSDMNLYEHQSTYNPNMPLRGMMYFSTLYSQFLAENNKNIFGKSLVKIPTPRYIVFYNGDDSYPDCVDINLSDAFERPDPSRRFEWTATMLNINKGHNQQIMNKCQALFQYSEFIGKVKEYKKIMPLEDAVNAAVDYAISNNYLEGFFKKHKEGIMLSCLTEFNEETYRQGIYDDGFSDGFTKTIIQTIHMMQDNNTPKDSVIVQLIRYHNLSEQDAINLVNTHWE